MEEEEELSVSKGPAAEWENGSARAYAEHARVSSGHSRRT